MQRRILGVMGSSMNQVSCVFDSHVRPCIHHDTKQTAPFRPLFMPCPYGMGELSDYARLTSVYRVHRASSREQRPGRLKLAQR